MNVKKKTDIDQLIRIAKANKDKILYTDVTSDLNDATRFVIALDIKVGKHRVFTTGLYEAYKKWHKDPLTSHSFILQFSKLFQMNFTNGKRYYLLNYAGAELIQAAWKAKSVE